MKILLATDGSPFSDAAVEEVANRPWPPNTELKIISVAEPPTFPAVETWVPPDDYIENMQKLVEEQAQSIVTRAADVVRTRDANKLSVTAEVIVGHQGTSSPMKRRSGTRT
jgi:nucleotide-binding universal stress UspA family protein